MVNLPPQRILRALGEGVMGVDRQGRFTFLNPAALRLLGFRDEASVIGESAHALTHHSHPDGRPYPEEHCPIYRVIETGEALEAWQDLFWRSDGTGLPVQVYASPLAADDGEITGAVVSFQDRSHQQALERELREQKRALERERQLFIGGPTVVFQWRITAQWPVEYVSPNVQQVLGHSPEALLSGTVRYGDLIHPDDFRRVAEEVAHHRDLGSRHFEHRPYRVRHADGSYRWVYDSTVIDRRHNGPDYHYGYLVDITREKEIERALAEKEQRYRMAQSAARFGIWEWDISTDRVHWDDDAWSLLGYPPEQRMDMDYATLREHIHPDDREAAENAIYQHLIARDDGSYSLELRLRRADGDWHWIHARGQVVARDAEGFPRQVLGIHTDISELKAAEQSPRDQRYRRFLEDFIGIAYQRRLGEPAPVLLRGMVAEITGYNQADFMGGHCDWTSLIHPEDRERVRQRIRVLIAEGGTSDLNYRIVHRDGSVRWVRDIGRLVRLNSQEDWVLQGAIYDITEQKEAERARDTFLAAVSHDLRTPLNTIAGFCGLLADTPLTPRQEEYLGYCRNAAGQLEGLIDTLLELSRLHAGGLRLQPRTLRLRQFLHEQLAPLEHQARNQGLTLHWHPDERLPGIVRGDPTRLAQVLNNLVGNAIKFTERGSVAVYVTPEGDERISFRVSDTGPGIPEALRASVFEPFARGDPALHRAPGSGLGLAICKELVALMGGRIEVTSTEGCGTTFSFTVSLPTCEATDAPTEADTGVHAPRRPIPGDTPPQAVVAEDEPTSALLLSKLLQRAGWEVTTVSDGEEAIAAWQQAQPDLMILDMQMSHTNGDRAATRIRELERRHRVPYTPIVILTAHALDDVRERALQAGCDRYLTKPVATDALHAVLDWARGQSSG
ncbi:PAS domain-containing protein [Halorhodospira sp. 9622]|uniref:PAS domain-containing protein n=1 Tax=Halorhodospira sp. 9622 TaxID=2899136 RepID=UPI001EE94AC6|nr:PAS domain-containing protein [Halorhodospira sp. 9622]MCG5538754.1 PAS domain-containing protein [Halorhodospira sp. 9622]